MRKDQKEIVLHEGGDPTGASRVTMVVDADLPDAEVEALRRSWFEDAWKERVDWAQRRVVQVEASSSGGGALAALVLVNVAAWAVTALAGAGGLWPLILLPVACAIPLALVLLAFLRRRKFGTSVIECRTMPARLGGRFQGTLETGVPLRGRSSLEFQLKLSCLRRTVRRETGAGATARDRVSDQVLWKHEETARGAVSSKGPTFQVGLDLAIPGGLPPADPLASGDRTLWLLELRAPDPGIGYSATFELPVFPDSP